MSKKSSIVVVFQAESREQARDLAHAVADLVFDATDQETFCGYAFNGPLDDRTMRELASVGAEESNADLPDNQTE